MAALFRPDPDDDVEEQDEAEAPDDGQLLPEVPEFAVIVSDVSNDGWHVAALIGEHANPDFYVRAVTVRWPFLIARPVRSSRASDKPVNPDSLSPTGTAPARRLVVNWRWVAVEGSVAQLRFYVRRTAPTLLRAASSVKVRLTLKESAWPGRRILVRIKSNRVTWNPRTPEETPASPPEQST
ncbi:MAG TPA: hypothetical protein VGL95_16285 [Acetobacteraceae bacterium]|jgi:hypothetical protein